MSQIKKMLTPENSSFALAVEPQFTFSTPAEGSNEKKKRMFAGVAYSGGAIENHWYWGKLVFDLETMSLPTKLPALIDHDRSKRAGFATEFNKDNSTGLTVAGTLLSNESGKSVADDSDEGFPWQMSVHITPNSVEEVAQGATVVVNGQTWVGPVTIFRNSNIQEVSFTATGWDSNTSATALSKKANETQFNQQQENDMEDLVKANARIAELETQLAASNAANADLNAKFSKLEADQRDADIKQLFADTGIEYKADADDVKMYAKMDKETFTFSANTLKNQVAKTKSVEDNTTLFGHQATTGADTGVQTSKESPLIADAKARAGQK